MKQKVLVIFEDEEAYSELQIALESTTIATVFAVTPDDAIRLFINHEYCLVIIDASVSDADGQKLLKIMQTISEPRCRQFCGGVLCFTWLLWLFCRCNR